MEFTGFVASDFSIFHIPDFAGRMGAIRSGLRPRLVALGEDLAARVAALTGLPAFPHAAQHMRRRVNPPEETWVAFGRDRKGYKRWAHYRIALSASGVRVTVFVEDDADDKPPFGENLAASAPELLAALGQAPVLWYTLDGAGPVPQAELTAARLREAGAELCRRKLLKFQAGIALDGEAAAALDAARFEEWALEQMERLRPLYLAAAAADGP